MEVVADANVLLSAAIGGRAKSVLQHARVTAVYTTNSVFDEIFEYVEHLARKRRLPLDEVMLAAAALPVTVVEEQEYTRHRSEARRRIGARDPDDVEVLALALHLNLPVWSNGNDFEVAGVEWHTTAEMLKILRISTR